jgi:acetyl-CoA/propionyl-CoA carboxylase biotin carboxyl carrier protein
MDDQFSPRQAAERIGSTTRTVQRWIATGKLPARRVGGRWRVASDAIDAFANGPHADGADATRPIRTLFIANRGEIARRIVRTADTLGIKSIVPDTQGPHAVDLLSIEDVIAAATAAEADALHPGFGFLAENAAFADAVSATGILWIGPPAAAIRTMGDKGEARRLAGRLGIRTVPGFDDLAQSDEALLEAATRIGAPLIVKPAAGGGGKGMRVVRSLDDLPSAIAAARREAKAAFEDERLILERLVEGARHVEVQLLFDRHGAGIHLGERDCSIQRRHQKILEESPSPGLDEPKRRRLSEAALLLARAVGYESAGTGEFLVGERGEVYFLEMNTRLQVEHPVTEAVTGRDLVADQIRIAAGATLGLRQDEVVARGHAIEVRLYAEDPEAGFLPASGSVVALEWPVGEGVRVDAGVDVGTEVTERFDPMLAKIIAHGRDRPEALARLTEALDQTLILGLTTNLRFLRWLVREPAILSGQARIDTLERIWPPDDWAERIAIPDEAWSAAASILGTGGWRLNGPQTIRLATDDAERTVRWPSSVEDAAAGAHAAVVAGGAAHLDLGGRSVAFRAAPPPDVDRAARAAAAQGHGIGSSELTAPMPGSVLAVHVSRGDTVNPGDPVVTLEAMKMEHVVTAPGPGRVSEIAVAPGDQVARGLRLATIEG